MRAHFSPTCDSFLMSLCVFTCAFISSFYSTLSTYYIYYVLLLIIIIITDVQIEPFFDGFHGKRARLLRVRFENWFQMVPFSDIHFFPIVPLPFVCFLAVIIHGKNLFFFISLIASSLVLFTLLNFINFNFIKK